MCRKKPSHNKIDHLKGVGLHLNTNSTNLPSDKETMTDGRQLSLHIKSAATIIREANNSANLFVISSYSHIISVSLTVSL